MTDQYQRFTISLNSCARIDLFYCLEYEEPHVFSPRKIVRSREEVDEVEGVGTIGAAVGDSTIIGEYTGHPRTGMTRGRMIEADEIGVVGIDRRPLDRLLPIYLQGLILRLRPATEHQTITVKALPEATAIVEAVQALVHLTTAGREEARQDTLDHPMFRVGVMEDMVVMVPADTKLTGTMRPQAITVGQLHQAMPLVLRQGAEGEVVTDGT